MTVTTLGWVHHSDGNTFSDNIMSSDQAEPLGLTSATGPQCQECNARASSGQQQS